MMEESITATPNTLGDNEEGVLVKVQSANDSEMYRIAKVILTVSSLMQGHMQGVVSMGQVGV